MKPSRDDPDKFRPERYPPLAFSEASWHRFRRACEDLEIPLEPGRKPVLEALYSHLVGVNGWMNLTTLTAVDDYLKFHVLDSLTAYDVVDELTVAGDLCLDLGSGGGYPGLPLMTWLPDRRWVLVDSRQKKAAFLAEAVQLTPCRSATAAAFRGREVRHARPDLAGGCALVTARAVGRADKLVPEAADLLRHGGFLILLKGPTFAEDERRALVDGADEYGLEVVNEMTVALDVDDPERIIVMIRKTSNPTARR